MQHLTKAVYIPKGCTYQGRQSDGVHGRQEDYISQRQEQAADQARLCGADTESAEDTVQRMHCLPDSAERYARVLIGGVILLLAVVGLVSVLVAVLK